MPANTNAFLNVRSLAEDHRRLAELLRPGLEVLDVGCGTGAITRGIAEAVAPSGRVVGLDASSELLAEARATHGDVPCLSFEHGEVHSLPHEGCFDIVTAARTLLWLTRPLDAIRQMARATRPGGRVLVLDLNHEKILWEPEPPESMLTFYRAFLRWRADAGMENEMADRLAAMFAEAGLEDIQVHPQHEVARRGAPDFVRRFELWAHAAASRGRQMVTDGYLSEPQRAAAEADWHVFIREGAEHQRLYLLAVEGTRR